jgi:hypothetical protein
VLDDGINRAEATASGFEVSLQAPGCSTTGDQKDDCTIEQGSEFVVTVSLDAIPAPFTGLATSISYSGVASKNNPDMDWPGCVGEGQVILADRVHGLCLIAPNGSAVTYTGPIMTASFHCASDGVLSIFHGVPDTVLADTDLKLYTDEGPDVLNVDCVPGPPVGGVALASGDSGGGGNTFLIAAIASLVAVIAGCGVWRVRARSAC